MSLEIKKVVTGTETPGADESPVESKGSTSTDSTTTVVPQSPPATPVKAAAKTVGTESTNLGETDPLAPSPSALLQSAARADLKKWKTEFDHLRADNMASRWPLSDLAASVQKGLASWIDKAPATLDPVINEMRDLLADVGVFICAFETQLLQNRIDAFPETVSAYSLAKATDAAECIIRGGGKAEVEQGAEALQKLMATDTPQGAKVRAALVALSKTIAAANEMAWEEAGLVSVSLSRAKRIELLSWDLAPKDAQWVDEMVARVAEAVAAGDGRFAAALARRIRLELPDTFRLSLAGFWKSGAEKEAAKNAAITQFDQIHGPRGLSHSAIEGFNDQLRNLSKQAYPARLLQRARLLTQGGTNNPSFETTQLGYLVKEAQGIEPVPEKELALLLDSLAEARGRYLTERQAPMDQVVAGWAGTDSLFPVDVNLFEDAAQGQQLLSHLADKAAKTGHTQQAQKAQARAEAFLSELQTRLPKAEAAWQKQAAQVSTAASSPSLDELIPLAQNAQVLKLATIILKDEAAQSRVQSSCMTASQLLLTGIEAVWQAGGDEAELKSTVSNTLYWLDGAIPYDHPDAAAVAEINERVQQLYAQIF